MSNAKMLEFKELGDDRGQLVVLEGFDNIPFDIKRLFYIYGSDENVIRGCHANRDSEFVLINIAGKSKVKIIDEFGVETIYSLDSPTKGIYIPKMIWKEMYDFSEDSVLLCISSEHYNGDEYIRSFNEYQEIVKK